MLEKVSLPFHNKNIKIPQKFGPESLCYYRDVTDRHSKNIKPGADADATTRCNSNAAVPDPARTRTHAPAKEVQIAETVVRGGRK